MQHSPQEIKSRLDRAVDPEGNVLDMAAVLELISTLERLPITREALEATRIGKTINLLRKKTDNEVLAKRAKKLVKKWQKLVINQIEATRSVDSPINGSRLSSPQINGTLSESGKSSTPTLTDKTVKTISINDYKTRGLKRKRISSSSTRNSPLNLVETSTPDKTRPPTPTNTSNDSKSLIPSNGSSSKNEFIQSKEISSSVAHKKPKLMEDQTKLLDEKDGTSIAHTSESSAKHITNTGNSDKDSIAKDNVVSGAQDETNIVDDSSLISGSSRELQHNVNNSNRNSETANFSNVNDNVCKNEGNSNVNTDGQNHSTLTQRENTNLKHTGAEEEENGLDNEYTNTGTTNSQKDSMCKDIDSKQLDARYDDVILESTDNLGTSQMSQNRTAKELKETSSEEMEESAEDIAEPKELVLDMKEEANGINGRYNDNGTWYAWTDVMPYNDGTLNILPYVILD